jgi:hypothetical protein
MVCLSCQLPFACNPFSSFLPLFSIDPVYDSSRVCNCIRDCCHIRRGIPRNSREFSRPPAAPYHIRFFFAIGIKSALFAKMR